MTLSPALGHALIKNMTVENDTSYLSNNEALQSIYVNGIMECLDMLKQMKAPENLETDSSYDSQYESDHATSGVRNTYKQCEKLVNKVYDLLALVDPSPLMSRLEKKIDRVFLDLLQSKYDISPECTVVFEIGRIYSCLVGRPTPFLINRLHEVEEYVRTNQATEEGVASKGLKRKVSEKSDSEEWRELFYEALYDKKHPLESVVVRVQLVSPPDLIWSLAILKPIHAGVGFGSGTETCVQLTCKPLSPTNTLSCRTRVCSWCLLGSLASSLN